MLDPTQRFTTRVDNYVKYRPRYPATILDVLQAECGLTSGWHVADIGSGTGILTELFLTHGNPTWGVEPNDAMRGAAERLLARYPNFTSVNGTAERTGLPEGSMELITVGQALHWFDLTAAKAEFQRVLRPGGWVAIAWNERFAEGTPFQAGYEQVMHTCAMDYGEVNHRHITEAEIRDFLGPGETWHHRFENAQRCDFSGLQGRVMSASYAPEPGHPNYAPMMAELERLFNAYQQDGQITMDYQTQLYFGRM